MQRHLTGDPNWDLVRLRRERLEKVQKEMAARGIGAMLLNNPVHLRYATGLSVMPIWTSVNLARYAVVPVSGDPVIYEYGKALFRAKEIWSASRSAQTWQYRFAHHTAAEAATALAKEIQGLMHEWGVSGSKLAVDVIDTYGFQGLTAQGLKVVDADEPMEAAKLVKTSDEIVLIEQSCMVAEAALSEMERAIKPGISEHELMGVFWGKMLSLGGEHCSTRLLVSGEKTNPWFQEAGNRRVRPGDLVGIDTDMIGPEGYLCDISRTFLCGDKPNADQKEAYRIAYDFIHGVMELCRPGMSYRDLMDKAPRYPDEYVEQGYSCMIHGDGLDDEPPFFPFPQEGKGLAPEGVFVENMVLSVEFYAGKKGCRDGVKLEEQIQITGTGSRLLARYPFDERML